MSRGSDLETSAGAAGSASTASGNKSSRPATASTMLKEEIGLEGDDPSQAAVTIGTGDDAGERRGIGRGNDGDDLPTAGREKDRPNNDVSERKRTRANVALACLLQSFCSVSMVLTNKGLASSYNHLLVDADNINVLLVVFQALVAMVCVETCKRGTMDLVDYPDFDLRTARLWAPVNVLFCSMLFTGMASLRHNNVPMVTVFKNVTNILITAGDYRYFNSKVEPLVLVAFAVMLGGACLAAFNDVHVTLAGVLWMGANCLSTAGYVLYMKFATDTIKLSRFGMVYYNNVLCVAFLLPAAVLLGEVSTLWRSTALHTWRYALTNIFGGLVGFLLNFSSLNCVAVTGPTTYAVVGSVNKVPISLLGYLLFDGEITPRGWFFIGVSMTGGFIYSYAKIRSATSASSSSSSSANLGRKGGRGGGVGGSHTATTTSTDAGDDGGSKGVSAEDEEAREPLLSRRGGSGTESSTEVVVPPMMGMRNRRPSDGSLSSVELLLSGDAGWGSDQDEEERVALTTQGREQSRDR